MLRTSPLYRDVVTFSDEAIVMLRKLEREFGNFKVSRPELFELDDNYFADNWHVNKSGAEKYTNFLVDLLRGSY